MTRIVGSTRTISIVAPTNAIESAAALLAAGEYAEMANPSGYWGITGNRAIQWMTLAAHWDAARYEIQIAGKDASSQTATWGHAIYDAVTNTWSNAGDPTSLLGATGHNWANCMDPVTGDYYLRYTSNRDTYYDRSAQGFVQTPSTSLLPSGFAPPAAMFYHPNCFGAGQPGIVHVCQLRVISYDPATQIYYNNGSLGASSIYNYSSGCGMYSETLGYALCGAIGANTGDTRKNIFKVLDGIGASSNCEGEGLIAAVNTNPPVVIKGGGIGGPWGKLIEHPGDPGRFLIITEHGGGAVYDSTDGGVTWNLKGYTHPFEAVANDGFAIGWLPYGVIAGIGDLGFRIWKPGD